MKKQPLKIIGKNLQIQNDVTDWQEFILKKEFISL